MSNWIAINNIAVYNKCIKYIFFVEYTNQRKVKDEKRKPAKFTSKIPRYFRAVAIFYYCWAFYRLLLFKLNQGDLMLVNERYNGSFWHRVQRWPEIAGLQNFSDAQVQDSGISHEEILRNGKIRARSSSRVTWMTWGLGLWINTFVNKG